MKKRLLSFVMALALLLSIVSVGGTAFAVGKTPVWDYYSKKGSYKVGTLTFTLEQNDFTYKIWYPKNIKGKAPVILYCNGTSSNYEKAPGTVEFLTRAASHGFICLTNTDQNCGTGASMDAGMTKLIALGKTKGGKLYGKVDLNRVGITGHSQGATCTMNLSDKKQYANAKYYKAICAMSLPTNALAESPLQNCPYDSSHVRIPTLLISGTGATDEGFICPWETSVLHNFKRMNGDVYVARKTGVEHAASNDSMASYMIAWFDYQLCGRAIAAKAFTGKAPELKTNAEWQDFKVKIAPKAFSLKKVKAGKRAFKAVWKKVNTVSGYQVKYADNKKMKHSKTVKQANPAAKTATVKGLRAKKTYYVRVRAYTRVGNKNYYSRWSKVKKVTTR